MLSALQGQAEVTHKQPRGAHYPCQRRACYITENVVPAVFGICWSQVNVVLEDAKSGVLRTRRLLLCPPSYSGQLAPLNGGSGGFPSQGLGLGAGSLGQQAAEAMPSVLAPD